jgi:SAM-dependent methyltransferase
MGVVPPSSANLYDDFYRSKDYAGEAAEVTRIIRESHPDATTLLDVACGTGLHLAQLSQHFACEGLDLDPQMVAVAQRRLPDLRFTCGDMASFDLGRCFDAVTCLFSSIGHNLTPQSLAQTIATMARHLHPGGVLVVEPWISLERWIEPGVNNLVDVDLGDRRIVRLISTKREGRTSILRIHYVHAHAGDIETVDETHRLGMFEREEYLEAFAAAGLVPQWLEGGLTGRGLVVGRLV